MLEPVTAEFIRSVSQLPPDQLANVADGALARWRTGGRDASRSLKLSASEYSAVEHAVGSALRPRADELNSYRQHLLSQANSTTVIAARAILKRQRVSPEHFTVLMEPFTEVGVAVPAHS